MEERHECGGCNGEGVERYAVGDVEHVATCRQCQGEGWRWSDAAEAHATMAEGLDVDAALAELLPEVPRWEPSDEDLDRMERELGALLLAEAG